MAKKKATSKQAAVALRAVDYPKEFRTLVLPKVGDRKTQTEFWAQYGVTQSGGSRYESGRDINNPLRILMMLHLSGMISDEQLFMARELVV